MQLVKIKVVNMIERMKRWIAFNTPRIYNLPSVVMVKWRNSEYIFTKNNRF